MFSSCKHLFSVLALLGCWALSGQVQAAPQCDINGGTVYVGCETPLIKWDDGYAHLLNSKDEAVYSNLRNLLITNPQYSNGLQTAPINYTYTCGTNATDSTYTTFALVGGAFPSVKVHVYGYDTTTLRTCTGGATYYPYTSFENLYHEITPVGKCRRGFESLREIHADVPHTAPYYGFACKPVEDLTSKQESLPIADDACETCAKAKAGNPVALGSSDKQDYVVDLKTGGPFPILWDRSYSSSGFKNWQFMPQRSLKIVKLPTFHYLHFRRGDGSWLIYKAPIPATGAPHVWASDQWIYTKDTVLSVPTDILDGSGVLIGVKLTNKSGGQEIYSAAGSLTQEINPVGLSHTFTYTTFGRLSSISDDYGHHLDIGYTTGDGAQAQIATWVLPPGGTGSTTYTVMGYFNGEDAMLADIYQVKSVSDGTRTVSYDYAAHEAGFYGESNLITVHHADGTTTGYVYGETIDGVNSLDTLLTGIVDEAGNRLSSYKYTSTSSRTVGKEWKHTGVLGGQTEVYLFTTSNMTDPLGNQFAFSTNYAQQITYYSKDCRWCRAGLKAKYSTYTGSGSSYGGLPDTMTDFKGNNEKRTYDTSKRLLTITQAYGTSLARTITFTWDGTSRRPATITVPIKVAGTAYTRTTTYTYDSAGRVLTEVVSASNSAPSRTTTYTYTTAGLLETATDPSGIQTRLTYDASGEVATATQAYGTSLAQTTTFGGYTASGSPGWSTNAAGVSTRYTWNTMDRPTKVEVGIAGTGGPGGTGGTWSATTLTYTPFGEVATLTQPDGIVFEWSYNVAHRATQLRQKSATGALLGQVDYTLNAAGEVSAETVSSGSTVLSTRSYTLDTTARLDKIVGAASQQTDVNFDAQGNPSSVIDPLLHTTSFAVDALNRTISQTNALSGVASKTFGPQDEVLTATDARGKSTGYSYNAFGDLVGLSSPDAGTTGMVIDSAGRTTSKTDPRGVVASFTYDAINRPTGIAWNDAGVSGSAVGFVAGTRSATLAYDSCTGGVGRLCTISDISGALGLAYDTRGRLSDSVFTPYGKTWTLPQVWVFDGADRETSHTYPSGKVLTSTYGTDGRLASLSFDGTTVASGITWQAMNGPIVGWAWGATPAGSVGYTYDQDGQITGITTPGLNTLLHDADGQITATTDSVNTDLNRVFTYDALHRLKTADRAVWGSPFTYGYDANTNLTSTTSGTTVINNAISSTSNRLNSVTPTIAGTPGTTVNWTYDAAGNAATLGPGFTLFYDATGRLVRSGSGITATSFTVDTTGLRRSKTTPSGTYAGEAYYAYDQSRRLVGIYDASGAPTQEFIYPGDSWQVLAVVKAGVIYPVRSDQLGSPNQVLDPTTGTAIWSWNAGGEPWGGQAPNEDPDANAVNFNLDLRFPGQIFDREVGLVHNGFRDYDPGTGRYVQSDPIGLAGGWNTYGYVGGDPMYFIDPLGLDFLGKCLASKYEKAYPNLEAAWVAVRQERTLTRKITPGSYAEELRNADHYLYAKKLTQANHWQYPMMIAGTYFWSTKKSLSNSLEFVSDLLGEKLGTPLFWNSTSTYSPPTFEELAAGTEGTADAIMKRPASNDCKCK